MIDPQRPSHPTTFKGCSGEIDRSFSSVTSYRPVNTYEPAIMTSPTIELPLFSFYPIEDMPTMVIPQKIRQIENM